MSRYKNTDKCPCGARANAAMPRAGVCSACDVRTGHERFLRMEGHDSESGRVFGAEFVAEPVRTTISVNGATIKRDADPEQLLLDLKQCSGKTRPRPVNPARALAALEKRGTDALEELDAPVGKRAVSEWLTYVSMDGEVLRTTLRPDWRRGRVHQARVSLPTRHGPFKVPRGDLAVTGLH